MDQGYFHQIVRPLLAAPHVEYMGEIGEERKSHFLGQASALLFPIDWPEPFGLVMIEAMACGTPVIAWNRGSVSEVVEHGVTGFIVQSMEEAVKAVERVGCWIGAWCAGASRAAFAPNGWRPTTSQSIVRPRASSGRARSQLEASHASRAGSTDSEAAGASEFYISATSSLAERRLRTLKHADTFALFDHYGDLGGGLRSPEGIFHEDTRFLSRLYLTVEGKRPLVLSSTVQNNNTVLDVDLTNPDLFEGDALVLPKDTVHIARAKFPGKPAATRCLQCATSATSGAACSSPCASAPTSPTCSRFAGFIARAVGR